MSIERKIIKVISILLVIYGVILLAQTAFNMNTITNNQQYSYLFIPIVVEGFLTSWSCIFGGVDGVRGSNRPSKIQRFIIWMIVGIVIQVGIVIASAINPSQFGENNAGTLGVSAATVAILAVGLICGLRTKAQAEK